VDLAAVRVAPVPLLACGAVAAARNVLTLVEDAEVLSAAGRPARAYSLAVLAVEELGKAGSLSVLAAMPENVRAQAPIGRLLEWHQMKLLKGTLLTEVQVGPAGVCARLAAGPFADLEEMVEDAEASARDEDRVRLRGLYVDVDHSGRVQQPSEVTAPEVLEQLARARRAASVASEMLDPGALERIANPDPCTVEFSRAMINAFRAIGKNRSPEAAADVVLSAASELRG